MSNEYLENIYYNPAHPASYSGAQKLYRFVKKEGKHELSLKQIKEWLSSQETYTVYKSYPLKYATQKILPYKRDLLWDSDLADFQAVSNYNDGYNFVCVIIDIFSRYLWAKPIHRKTGVEVTEVFRNVFKDDRKPDMLRTDKGTEYTNKTFQNFVKRNDVLHYTTNNENKANYAERVIRTLKGRIYKIFYKNQSYRYIDEIQDVVGAYNSSVHSTIKMQPRDVTKDNQLELWMTHYLPLKLKEEKQIQLMKTKKRKFKEGDTVRVTALRGAFPREYHQRFSEEYFMVKTVKTVYPVRYKLEDLNGEDIKGSFYAQELQKIVPPTVFKIEKIIRYEGKGFKRKALVRWMGYSPQFDTWISDNDVKDYK